MPTVSALDLLTTVGVHSLVAAEVRELGVCFQTDFTLERFDAAVDMLVLLQAARRGERLAAVGTRVRSGAAEGVRRSDVALQVAGVCK